MKREVLKKISTPQLFSPIRKTEGSFKMIDLFAGIGGIRLGFEAFGGETVFTSEWDKHAQITYQANFGELPHGDITKIRPEQIEPFDVLLAGFPCQPFSQAGLKKGLTDTRGTLFFDIAQIIAYHKPSVVFLENVKRFKTHDGGRTFEIVEKVLTDLGYTVHAKVLNAKNFGVPQNRERIYIVAFRGKTNFEFPEASDVKTRLGNILEKRVHSKYTLSDALWKGHQRRKKMHEKKGNGFGYSLFNRNSKYTNTISARYYKDGSEILIEQKGKNPRRLTPREAARLQGYEDTFVIPVSDGQAYKQFGNSVAVPVIRAIAKRVVDAMKKLEVRKKTTKSAVDLLRLREESIAEAQKTYVPLKFVRTAATLHKVKS